MPGAGPQAAVGDRRLCGGLVGQYIAFTAVCSLAAKLTTMQSLASPPMTRFFSLRLVAERQP